jgi:hypothetical protein
MTELVENILIGVRKWVNSKMPSRIVTGVKSGDTVLSLSGTEIQSTISVAIEKKTVGQAQVDHIVLKGIGGAEIASVDASAFVKDGMIDSVAWSQESGKTNVLVITWNTESGKQSTEIDFARFIDNYVEGDGISVSGSVISIKIDPTPGNVTLSATSTGLKANVDLSGYSVTGHTHTLGDVSGLTEALSGKSNTGHTHQISDVSGLTETLEDFSEVVSSHINEIEDTLERKSDTGHTHQVSEVNGLTDALSGKANASHSHAISDVSGLTEALSGKSNTGHTHQVSEVSGLSNALSGKANASHSHAISDVSGLTETLEDFSEVVSSHINEIEENINEIEENIEGIGFEELEYDECALYTQESENIMAHGMVSKVGKTVTMQIYNANTKDGWGEICYRLPYAPDSTYVPVVNSRGMYESNGIHYKVSIQDRIVEINGENVTYPALILVHYINGSPANWEYGQNVIFKIDYITTE